MKGLSYIPVTPYRGLVLVMDTAQIQELSQVPEAQLSLHGVASDVKLLTF